jgi:hypothetical protein
MKYYIGIDTQDLDGRYGKGAVVVYHKNESEDWIIIEGYETIDRKLFEMKLEELKEKYNPYTIID